MGKLDDNLQGQVQGIPIVSGLAGKTPAEVAREEQVKDARHVSAETEAYRPEVQGAYGRQKDALAGLLGPLNSLVQAQTGQSINLGNLAARQMVSESQAGVGETRGNKEAMLRDEFLADFDIFSAMKSEGGPEGEWQRFMANKQASGEIDWWEGE